MVNPLIRTIDAASTGYIALETLAPGGDARVMGISSRGIFIKTAGAWLVFVSFGRFRGPLTLNLSKFDDTLASINTGDLVKIQTNGLLFPHIDLNISTAGCEVWRAPLRPTLSLPETERRKNVTQIASAALTRGVELSPYLPAVLNLLNSQAPPARKVAPEGADVHSIHRYLRENDLTNLIGSLGSFLGAGEGLTPGGDDFLIGLLLSINRWGDVLWPGQDIGMLNQSVIEAAYEGTTTLSANLIDCAVRGQADERLINALDWMMSGDIHERDIITNLLGWGHSSGVNAFAGMASVITA
jgi:hypothetical protein